MASPSWRYGWVTKKCKIANNLARGEAGGSYSEAAILVCTVLSALAAEVWPGRGSDRARFVELLVRLGSSPSSPMIISVPLFVQHLETTSAENSKDCATIVVKKFLAFQSSRVLTGSEVDKMECELESICPTLMPATIRKFSYANLLYEQVRSSYAHEYRPGDKADSWPMTASKGQCASYVNRLLGPGIPKTERLIHFHIAWLTTLAVDLAGAIDAISDTVPHQKPKSWWIHGAP